MSSTRKLLEGFTHFCPVVVPEKLSERRTLSPLLVTSDRSACLLREMNQEGGVRVCRHVVLLNFRCGFAEIFILICGIAVLQNQAVCGIQKFSGNFNAVCSFVTLFCAVFICISVQFAVFVPRYAPLGFKVTVLTEE